MKWKEGRIEVFGHVSKTGRIRLERQSRLRQEQAAEEDEDEDEREGQEGFRLSSESVSSDTR